MAAQKPITLVDYGMGNLHSVAKALEHCNASVELTSSPDVIAKARVLVLPGVGAFADGMTHLEQRGLIAPIKDYLAQQKPFLGICLGMQMLFEDSEEFGARQGLGVLKGKVCRLPEGPGWKVPHMGWNTLTLSPAARASALWQDLPENPIVYFVHSYHVVPRERAAVAATCTHGTSFVAAVQENHLIATQFHPEKSHAVGLRFLENFVRWAPV